MLIASVTLSLQPLVEHPSPWRWCGGNCPVKATLSSCAARAPTSSWLRVPTTAAPMTRSATQTWHRWRTRGVTFQTHTRSCLNGKDAHDARWLISRTISKIFSYGKKSDLLCWAIDLRSCWTTFWEHIASSWGMLWLTPEVHSHWRERSFSPWKSVFIGVSSPFKMTRGASEIKEDAITVDGNTQLSSDFHFPYEPLTQYQLLSQAELQVFLIKPQLILSVAPSKLCRVKKWTF